jgi:hypothetical protein
MELGRAPEFDVSVVNDDLATAVDAVDAVVTKAMNAAANTRIS